MSPKWRGFFIGTTLILNALVVVILLVPLGLSTVVIQKGAACVVILDILIELALFLRS